MLLVLMFVLIIILGVSQLSIKKELQEKSKLKIEVENQFDNLFNGVTNNLNTEEKMKVIADEVTILRSNTSILNRKINELYETVNILNNTVENLCSDIKKLENKNIIYKRVINSNNKNKEVNVV